MRPATRVSRGHQGNTREVPTHPGAGTACGCLHTPTGGWQGPEQEVGVRSQPRAHRGSRSSCAQAAVHVRPGTAATQSPACAQNGRCRDSGPRARAFSARGPAVTSGELAFRDAQPAPGEGWTQPGAPPPGQDSFGGGVPSPPACTRSPAQGAAPGGSRPAGPVPGGSTRSNLLSFLILGRGWRGPGSEPLRVLAPAALRAALPPPPAPPPTPSGRGAECWVLDAGCSRVPAESQPSCTRPGKLGARNSSGTRRCKE